MKTKTRERESKKPETNKPKKCSYVDLLTDFNKSASAAEKFCNTRCLIKDNCKMASCKLFRIMKFYQSESMRACKEVEK